MFRYSGDGYFLYNSYFSPTLLRSLEWQVIWNFRTAHTFNMYPWLNSLLSRNFGTCEKLYLDSSSWSSFSEIIKKWCNTKFLNFVLIWSPWHYNLYKVYQSNGFPPLAVSSLVLLWSILHFILCFLSLVMWGEGPKPLISWLKLYELHFHVTIALYCTNKDVSGTYLA